MSQHLLAAEADQIQDFIFRASHLREVVGGSQLLTRFGDETKEESAILQLFSQIPACKCEVVSAGGGSFRLLFDTSEHAVEFGKALSEVYRLTTGGTLSVAEPALFEGDYRKAAESAELNLRRAKRSRGFGGVTAQLPYTAFCASCGVGLACEHGKRHPGDREGQYLCGVCRAKGRERWTNEMGDFLEPFFRKVVGDLSLDLCHWPGDGTGGSGQSDDPTEDMAPFDSRRYVGYLLADANSMGKVFGKCEKEQARRLSKKLTDTLQQSLAEPARLLMQHQERIAPFIPVLPLILGGDDLFALIPAPWAFDFAHRFCRTYDEIMKHVLEQLGLADLSPPTISVAVVICKCSYPYHLAHGVGEERLAQAKHVAKALALQKDIHSSVVNFEIITGSQLAIPGDKAESVRDTLRPYWISEGVPPGWGESMHTLLGQREELTGVPRKRRVQLRNYFDELRGTKLTEEETLRSGLRWLQSRIERDKSHGVKVKEALKLLGDKKEGRLRRMEASTGGGRRWSGHGLPDVLDAWDFTLKVDKPRRCYEEV